MPFSRSTATARKPQVRAIVNGVIVEAVTDAKVTSTNIFGPDSFSILAPLDTAHGYSAGFWSSVDRLDVDIQVRTGTDESFAGLIQGGVDTVAIDLAAGEVRLTGRDYSADLLEIRTEEVFSNQTASEIVSFLAGRHGLSPVVIPTQRLVGRFYQTDHDTVALDSFSFAANDWDLIVALARQERYDVFVSGRQLFFQPDEPTGAAPMLLAVKDLLSFHAERILPLGRPLEVVVRSWQSRLHQAVTYRASSDAAVSDYATTQGRTGRPRRYVFVRPNLTDDDAHLLAQRQLDDIIGQERRIEFTMPGDVLLTPRQLVRLTGTNSAFDQDYRIDVIEREIRPRIGFVQHVRARNSSPRPPGR